MGMDPGPMKGPRAVLARLLTGRAVVRGGKEDRSPPRVQPLSARTRAARFCVKSR
ncbi:hypothetical protein ASNO1_75870 [Corallococcus caeni]|uniref:Uncharacterized protein n=1 Tax=Corallococcus caeni TaxID=3082388 RepID=A0ABQ6R4W0_9BACT|nr:hypothetical protein ASNO1_75870 [Corallococcus sp. NO1]